MEEYLSELISIVIQKQEKLIIIPGKVKALTDAGCDISRPGQPDMLGVRLHSILKTPENYVKVEPKVGSDVLVAIIENHPTEGFLLSTSEIDKASVKIGSTALEVSKDGIKAERGDQNLKKILTDLMEATKNIQVVIPEGLAPVSPQSQVKIQKAIQALNQLLL